MKPHIEDPVWTAYILGELSPQDHARAESLLCEHPQLAADVREMEATLNTLQAAFAVEEPDRELEPLRRERVLREGRPDVLESDTSVKPWLPTAIAASLALGFGLLTWVAPGPELQESMLSEDAIPLEENFTEALRQRQPLDSFHLQMETSTAPGNAINQESDDGRAESPPLQSMGTEMANDGLNFLEEPEEENRRLIRRASPADPAMPPRRRAEFGGAAGGAMDLHFSGLKDDSVPAPDTGPAEPRMPGTIASEIKTPSPETRSVLSKPKEGKLNEAQADSPSAGKSILPASMPIITTSEDMDTQIEVPKTEKAEPELLDREKESALPENMPEPVPTPTPTPTPTPIPIPPPVTE